MATNYDKLFDPNAPITSAALAPTPSLNFQTPRPTPIVDIAGITAMNDQTFAPTPIEQGANDLTGRIMEAKNRLVGESAFRADQQQAAGIPALQKTQQDLTSQLRALAAEQQAIPLQLQQDATGRGITEGGLAPVQASALRKNAIQALSVSSLLQAVNGNLTTAMAQADRAVAQRFDPIREEIAALQGNLDLILKSPAYSLADKKRAQTQKDIQDARARALDQQEALNKEALARAAAAVTNNPNNQAALLAAQQVAQLDPADPLYMQKVLGLVGPYQSNPLDQQYKQGQIDLQRAQLAKTNLDITKTRQEMSGGGGVGVGGVTTQPAYQKLTAAQKLQADASNNIIQALNTYRANYEKLVRGSGSNIAGTDSALLESAYNSLIFQVAQAVGTGALQQADREVIEKVIPDPTTFWGSFGRILKGGKAGGLQKIDGQIQEYESRLKNYGLAPSPTNGGSSLDTLRSKYNY